MCSSWRTQSYKFYNLCIAHFSFCRAISPHSSESLASPLMFVMLVRILCTHCLVRNPSRSACTKQQGVGLGGVPALSAVLGHSGPSCHTARVGVPTRWDSAAASAAHMSTALERGVTCRVRLIPNTKNYCNLQA